MGFVSVLQSIFTRNRLVMAVIALTFLFVMLISAVVAYVILLTSPQLASTLTGLIGSARSYVALPAPYTPDLYRFIFLNNIGHFWHPERVLVWSPFVGAFSLGYELLLNATVIGGIASFVSVTRGASYAIAGLAPHGVIEIPAFIFEFVALARWHITMTRSIQMKLSGRYVDRPLLIDGIEDTAFLSLLSVALFAGAAYVESYITPLFLGL